MEYLSLKYIKTNYIKLYLIILRNKIICLKLSIDSYMQTIENYLIELIDRF